MEGQDALKLAVPVALLACAATAIYFGTKRKQVFLEKGVRKRAKIIDIKELSPDTKRFRLSLGSKSTILGLPVGKHLLIYAPNPETCLANKSWNGRDDPDKGAKEIDRKYTPVTGDETPGYVDLVIKVYRPGTVKMPDGKEVKWDDGGKLGLYLDSKQVGDEVEVKGPLGLIEYLGCGEFKLPGRTVKVKHVAMLAGGTGLTPMLQVVQAALRNKSDTTKFSLIYGNKTADDILCRDLLDEAVKESAGRFQVHYTLDFPPSGWSGKTGFITQEMIKECLPACTEDVLVLMCGPPAMVEHACKKNLDALGFKKEQMAQF
mmetsp:Transcript_66253/g.158483  ORF Transcript_66253/g.158483 Transcript_66253/m.158483 type:complete len:318 (+) Transcript_66253:91-1044(+)